MHFRNIGPVVNTLAFSRTRPKQQINLLISHGIGELWKCRLQCNTVWSPQRWRATTTVMTKAQHLVIHPEMVLDNKLKLQAISGGSKRWPGGQGLWKLWPLLPHPPNATGYKVVRLHNSWIHSVSLHSNAQLNACVFMPSISLYPTTLLTVLYCTCFHKSPGRQFPNGSNLELC